MTRNNVAYLPTGAPTGKPANEVTPVVGMPANYEIGSDCWFGKIVEVSRSGRMVVWQGHGGSCETFTRRRDGSYRLRGQNCGRLHLGDDSPTELDPSF
jgi:hypothetical protein